MVLFARRLLIACSLALNALLAFGVLHFMRAEQALRIDPFELDHWAADPLSPQPPAGLRRVIIFGDSRARQWLKPTAADGFEFVNRGVGLQTSAQVLGRFDRDLKRLSPSVVVLQLGVNDLKASATETASEQQILRRCQDNIAQLVQRSVGLGAHVVLSTIFSLGGLPWLRALYIPSETSQRVQYVNQFVRGLGSPHVSILDTQRILDDVHGSVRSEYRSDFLHLNAAGYDALNLELMKTLRAL
ncbi:MAG TPA: GDSL-type esterase/lipase family protein [Polyangiales bacterium]|nr:GDSL-type esterase/lipase family protein [Polyangiales bacterium]